MRDESQDSNRNVPESDGSEVETVVANHLTTFLFKLDLNTKKRLGDVMGKREHMVFTDTIIELINEEYDRRKHSA